MASFFIIFSFLLIKVVFTTRVITKTLALILELKYPIKNDKLTRDFVGMFLYLPLEEPWPDNIPDDPILLYIEEIKKIKKSDKFKKELQDGVNMLKKDNNFKTHSGINNKDVLIKNMQFIIKRL